MARSTMCCLLAACTAMLHGAAQACAPFIETRPDERSATFRAHRTALEPCEVDERSYRQVVAQWLHTRPAGDALSSLALGRAVKYPWISRHLADAALRSPGWAARVAATPAGRRDRLATEFIQDPALLARLALPFEGSAYRVTRVSFEKVLYGRADAHSSDPRAGALRVPFDAQLWLVLAPRR